MAFQIIFLGTLPLCYYCGDENVEMTSCMSPSGR